ncbi:MAG: hypothetical protein ACI9VN_002829, partial [Patescibacteria group bacterium]
MKSNKTMYKILIFFLLIIVNSQTIKSQSTDTIEGALIMNFTELQGFYGLEESIIKMYKDTINKMVELHGDSKEVKALINDYTFLQENGLLYKPCKFIRTKAGEKFRVYITEDVLVKINNTNWLNKAKKDNVNTYIKLSVKKLKEGTFFSDKVLKIDQTLYYYEELEEVLEIEPRSYTYKEIEDLFLNYESVKSIPKAENTCLYLRIYFEEIEKGWNPFDLFLDPTLGEIKTDTSTLIQFLIQKK